jgi:ribosomal protein S7
MVLALHGKRPAGNQSNKYSVWGLCSYAIKKKDEIERVAKANR